MHIGFIPIDHRPDALHNLHAFLRVRSFLLSVNQAISSEVVHVRVADLATSRGLVTRLRPLLELLGVARRLVLG